MWSDNETLSDFIDFTHLIGAVRGLIDNDNLLPCSIGIFGDWGGGKSSLMKMVEENYKGNGDVLVVRFNGWLFEGYEDAKTVLMGRIVDEIIKCRTFSEKAKQLAKKLLKKIDLLKLSGSALKMGVGFLAAGPTGALTMSAADLIGKVKDADYEEYINKLQKPEEGSSDSFRSNIQEFHANFEELIQETKIKKLVVLIDDLDRCSPDTIIGTLEAIKLFLFTSQTAFVIGADERLIKYAVRRRFPELPGESAEVGRDYLEKLIQFPIRIPPLNSTEISNFINLLFCQLFQDVGEFETVREQMIKDKQSAGIHYEFDLTKATEIFHEVNEDLKEAFQLCALVAPILTVGLNGNPRQCKRFLNSLLIRVEMAKSKGISLEKQVLAKLMVLEYFKPETFDTFYQLQAENEGKIPALFALEKGASSSGEDEEELTKNLSPEEEAYLQDAWFKRWLTAIPMLAGKDLHAYFYVSRDRLNKTTVSQSRMTPLAQEFFRKLTHESQAVYTKALENTGSLPPGDASAIFEALTQKVREAGKNIGEHSPLKRLFLFTQKFPDLLSQLIGFLGKYPEKDLTLPVLSLLDRVTAKTSYRKSARDLIKHWSKSEQNKKLASAAAEKLKKFE